MEWELNWRRHLWPFCCKVGDDIFKYIFGFVLRQHRGKFSMAKVKKSCKGHPFRNPSSLLTAACLQSGLLKVDLSSCQPWAGLWLQACPVRRLCPFVNLGGLWGQLCSYTVKPLCLDPCSANSIYHLLPLQSAAISDTQQSSTRHVSLSASEDGYVVLSSAICAFLQFFPLTVDSHCITAVCYNTGSHCEGSASIRVPIIIPNQLHFSI